MWNPYAGWAFEADAVWHIQLDEVSCTKPFFNVLRYETILNHIKAAWELEAGRNEEERRLQKNDCCINLNAVMRWTFCPVGHLRCKMAVNERQECLCRSCSSLTTALETWRARGSYWKWSFLTARAFQEYDQHVCGPWVCWIRSLGRDDCGNGAADGYILSLTMLVAWAAIVLFFGESAWREVWLGRGCMQTCTVKLLSVL